jgi:hypothetical protein
MENEAEHATISLLDRKEVVCNSEWPPRYSADEHALKWGWPLEKYMVPAKRI